VLDVASGQAKVVATILMVPEPKRIEACVGTIQGSLPTTSPDRWLIEHPNFQVCIAEQ